MSTSAGAVARAGINTHQFYSLDVKSAPSAVLAEIFSFDGVRALGDLTRPSMSGRAIAAAVDTLTE